MSEFLSPTAGWTDFWQIFQWLNLRETSGGKRSTAIPHHPRAKASPWLIQRAMGKGSRVRLRCSALSLGFRSGVR